MPALAAEDEVSRGLQRDRGRDQEADAADHDRRLSHEPEEEIDAELAMTESEVVRGERAGRPFLAVLEVRDQDNAMGLQKRGGGVGDIDRPRVASLVPPFPANRHGSHEGERPGRGEPRPRELGGEIEEEGMIAKRKAGL